MLKAGLQLVSSPCPLCSYADIEDIWTHESGITNGICSQCGHVHLTQRYSECVIEESYKDYGQSYPDSYIHNENGPLFDVARKRVAFLRKQLPGVTAGKILEIGCGYGHFLHSFEETAIKVGIEPSAIQANFARSFFGLEIIEGTLETFFDDGASGSPFDLVCSFHVLEHIIDPVNFIKQAKSRLSPGGYIFLAMPDLITLSPDLIELYFIYRNWHIHTFSKSTVTQLLENNGFKILKIESEEPTAMLRSSFVVLAQLSDAVNVDAVAIHRTASENRLAAFHFHNELNRFIDNLRKTFYLWRKEGKQVVIYGAGIHTQALLELTGISNEGIICIIDDDPAKCGSSLAGIPVVSMTEARSKTLDVLVVSSLASEHLILKRLLSSDFCCGIEIKGIYADLFPGSLGDFNK